MTRSVPSCWPAFTTWTASCSPSDSVDAAGAGVLRAEDELAVVGGAGRDRDVVRERSPLPL